MTYRILSIEDNPEEAKLLTSHVERYAAERELDLQLIWKKTAFDLVDAHEKFDLVFLDIELPGINGMEAAELIRSYDSETPIIFVTNLAQYAVKGYEVDALDFVVKPVTYFDFRLRMDKAMRVISRHAKHSITIPITGGFRVVNASDIIYVEVSNHDLRYVLVGDEELTARGSLSQLEK
ncbi:MAG: response regulator transcription factor [Atopobiaceae bacterium]|nr:response regulator transcription factor [Atopobiaceae bacterium]